MTKVRPGIRLFLILALTVFAFLVGVGSAMVEVATLTRVEVQSAVARAELAANLVISQLAVSLRSAAGADPAEVLRRDPRLGSVLTDAQQFTPSVLYLVVADTTDLALCHSDSTQVGASMARHPGLVPAHGLGLLRQFMSIVHQHEAWEVSVPVLLDDRDFGTVRVGLSPGLLREEMQTVLRTQIVKLILQVVLATAFGVAVSWIVILRPLSRIEAGIDHLQRGDFGYRVPVGSQDEVGHLARQINTLSEVLSEERAQLLLQRDTLVSEGDTLRRLVDAVDDGLLMIDPRRQVLMANRTACRILGEGFGAMAGRDLREVLSPGHPLVQMVDNAFGGDHRLESAPMEFSTGEGDRVYLGTCQVVGEGPSRQGAMITLRDYGRMRQIQEMLDHARVLSRLGKMAAGVAHEVRNPLNAMNIHLELLKQKLGDSWGAANQTHVDVVQREIARLERVVYGFLRLARLQELSLKPIDVGPFLHELRELVLPEARMAGVEIALDVAGNLPEIYGDEEVLRQALLNLLRNAIQASPAGSAPIAVSAYPDGERVRLTVEDCGEGIPVEVQANVFDLYFTTKKEGTGVGLALVQQAVEMHGGSINMRSKPGLGTAFIVTLPAFSGN